MNETQELVHRGRVLRHEIRTAADPSQVWRAWVDPALLTQWFADRMEGRLETGGEFAWTWDGFDVTVPYRVLVAEPERRLVAETDDRHGPGPLLEITIATRAGETVLTLVASGFGEGADWNDEYEGANAGWASVLAVLREYLAHHFGQPRSTFTAIRPARFAYDAVMTQDFRGPGLSRWLVQNGALGREGESFALALQTGEPFTGRVIAAGTRELAMTWNEINGILTLMVQPGAQGLRTLCAWGCGWGLSRERAAALAAQLGSALDRLAAQLG